MHKAIHSRLYASAHRTISQTVNPVLVDFGNY